MQHYSSKELFCFRALNNFFQNAAFCGIAVIFQKEDGNIDCIMDAANCSIAVIPELWMIMYYSALSNQLTILFAVLLHMILSELPHFGCPGNMVESLGSMAKNYSFTTQTIICKGFLWFCLRYHILRYCSTIAESLEISALSHYSKFKSFE